MISEALLSLSAEEADRTFAVVYMPIVVEGHKRCVVCIGQSTVSVPIVATSEGLAQISKEDLEMPVTSVTAWASRRIIPRPLAEWLAAVSLRGVMPWIRELRAMSCPCWLSNRFRRLRLCPHALPSA